MLQCGFAAIFAAFYWPVTGVGAADAAICDYRGLACTASSPRQSRVVYSGYRIVSSGNRRRIATCRLDTDSCGRSDPLVLDNPHRSNRRIIITSPCSTTAYSGRFDPIKSSLVGSAVFDTGQSTGENGRYSATLDGDIRPTFEPCGGPQQPR